MPRPVLIAIALLAGALIGVLGTMVHGNIWVIGDPAEGFIFPWGAVFALGLLTCALIWVGTTSGSLVEPLVMGATTFTVVSLIGSWTGPDQLMVFYTPEIWEVLPGPVVATTLWWLGSAGVTLVAMVIVAWILRVDSARRRTPYQDHPDEALQLDQQ